MRSRTVWMSLVGILMATAAGATLVSSIVASNFNGTPIPAGRWVWFNSNLKYDGPTNVPVSLYVQNATIEFTANAVHYTLPVPDAVILLSPTAAQATTEFDEGAERWLTTVPSSFGDDIFAAGLAFQAPVDLPGGINPVGWSADFSSSLSPVELHWKWGAAVYTSFTDDYDALDVNPVHAGAHAGVPNGFKAFVVGGARGGGGSNWTGSWSGTASVQIAEPTATQAGTWGSLKAEYLTAK